MLTDEQLEALFFGIYNGFITEWTLPANLYNNTASYLLKGLFQGYGKTFSEVGLNSIDYNVLKSLHDNIYVFSSAKTFQQVKDIQALIFDANGNKRPWNKFRDDAKKVNTIYNGYKTPDNWLKTEYNTAISQANSAAYWQQIQAEKETLPYLKFQTVKDAAVRPEHRKFDNVIRRVDDPFWNYAMVPLDFNCRCIVIQVDASFAKKETPKSDLPPESEVGKLFRFNPGKDNYIFETKGQNMHPYYKVEERYKLYKQNNFGMQIPKI